jgi:hypothetical protein
MQNLLEKIKFSNMLSKLNNICGTDVLDVYGQFWKRVMYMYGMVFHHVFPIWEIHPFQGACRAKGHARKKFHIGYDLHNHHYNMIWADKGGQAEVISFRKYCGRTAAISTALSIEIRETGSADGRVSLPRSKTSSQIRQ